MAMADGFSHLPQCRLTTCCYTDCSSALPKCRYSLSMSDHSAIEWTKATWNPTTGCTKISPGCDRCYAERNALRFPKGFPNGFDMTLRVKALELPLRWLNRQRWTQMPVTCIY